MVIALTHMREPNDERLAAEAPEFDAILGGHDHHYVAKVGRCRLSVSNPQLKAPMVSALETVISQNAFNPCFQF